MRVLSPSATPFNSGVTQSFPLTPSSHGCEGVSGKRRGAPGGGYQEGWARTLASIKADDRSSKSPGFSPAKWPGNTPDPGAHPRAHFRAVSRAMSRLGRAIPQSIAGLNFQPSRASNTVLESAGQRAAFIDVGCRNGRRPDGQYPPPLGVQTSGGGGWRVEHALIPRSVIGAAGRRYSAHGKVNAERAAEPHRALRWYGLEPLRGDWLPDVVGRCRKSTLKLSLVLHHRAGRTLVGVHESKNEVSWPHHAFEGHPTLSEVPIPDVGTVQCQHVEREATDRRTTSRGSRSQASK